MGYIADTKWHKKDVSVKWLTSNDFKYSKDYSDRDSDAYIYTFPVHKYKLMSLLECAVIVYSDNGDVIVKVQDAKTKEPYPQFSYDSQGNHKMFVNKLENAILPELKKFGITPLGNKNAKKVLIKYNKKMKTFKYYCPTCNEKTYVKSDECVNCGQVLMKITNEDRELAKKEAYVHE